MFQTFYQVYINPLCKDDTNIGQVIQIEQFTEPNLSLSRSTYSQNATMHKL